MITNAIRVNKQGGPEEMKMGRSGSSGNTKR